MIERLRDLATKSRRTDTYLYTNFLSPSDIALAFEVEEASNIKIWGGVENCERAVVRFGNTAYLGYDEDFPIRILEIKPINQKYADNLTHRDFLGAIMNLGIERDIVGDIFVDEKTAVVFVLEHMAEYISENLDRVRRTTVQCKSIKAVSAQFKPKLEIEEVIVSSVRIDGMLAKIYHLSRSAAQLLVKSGGVLASGKKVESTSYEPKPNETIIARGHGKFIFIEKMGDTRKGRHVIKVARYM